MSFYITFFSVVTKLCQVQEFFAHRADKLKERHFDQVTGWVMEFFAPGRLKHLRGAASFLLWLPPALVCEVKFHQIFMLSYREIWYGKGIKR